MRMDQTHTTFGTLDLKEAKALLDSLNAWGI
jgi:hypothetical protein